MKRISFLCGLLSLIPLLLPAQETVKKRANESIVSLQVGPVWHLGSLMGLTSPADSYRNDMRSGVAWNAAWSYDIRRDGDAFGGIVGLLYQGSRYTAAHEEGSDKVGMNYLAPQVGLSFRKSRFQLNSSLGLGYQFYKDKSEVFGKPRKVSINRVAFNLAFDAEYRLSPHWGLAARLNWILSHAENYRVDYHGETWWVHQPDGYGTFHQLGLLLGVNLHF